LARTIVFTALSMSSLIYIFSFRSLKSSIFVSENLFKNLYLYLALAYGVILVFVAVYLPILNKALGTVPLQAKHWFWVFLVGFIATACVELTKYFSHKKL